MLVVSAPRAARDDLVSRVTAAGADRGLAVTCADVAPSSAPAAAPAAPRPQFAARVELAGPDSPGLVSRVGTLLAAHGARPRGVSSLPPRLAPRRVSRRLLAERRVGASPRLRRRALPPRAFAATAAVPQTRTDPRGALRRAGLNVSSLDTRVVAALDDDDAPLEPALRRRRTDAARNLDARDATDVFVLTALTTCSRKPDAAALAADVAKLRRDARLDALDVAFEDA